MNGKKFMVIIATILTTVTLSACGGGATTVNTDASSKDELVKTEAIESENANSAPAARVATAKDWEIGAPLPLPLPQERDYREILTPFEKVDEIVSQDVANGFPGAQMCVMDCKGNILYSNAWGSIQTYNQYGIPLPADKRVPITERTLFDIGGTTEVFSAWYATLHLISIGQLSFGTRVADILGEQYVEDQNLTLFSALADPASLNGIDDIGNQIKAWRNELTVEDLLRNRSGNPEGPSYHKQYLEGMIIENPCYNRSGTRGESLALLNVLPTIREPRTMQAPNDVDAVTLTFIVEKITGKRFDVYVNELWTAANELPAVKGITGITYNPLEHGYGYEDIAATEISGNSRFGLVEFPRMRTGVVHGQVHDETAFYAMEGISGNAGLFANAESLCRLLLTYLSPEYGMFSEDVLRRMVTPTRLMNPDAVTSIGMAWYLEYDNKGELCEYWLNGFTRCYVGVLPQCGVVVAYLTNAIHSPAWFPSDNLAEHDLEHVGFAGNHYEAAAQRMLFCPEG